MRYRNDPKSGNEISALGLGCMRFPGFEIGRPSLATAERVIGRALEQGVNYLDTAYLYPGNEECVGRAVERLGAREQVFIATKLPHAMCKAPEDFDRIFDEQLKRLRTDHIDYYLVHNVGTLSQWKRVVDLGIEGWAARQKKAGRIRRFGFSFHGNVDDFMALIDAYDWDFCQIQYNYAGERYQAGTRGLKAAAARGMAVFVMEPLLGGRLAGKLPAKAKRVFEEAADERLGSPAAWSLAWLWNRPEVTMVLSGMTSPEQVDENAQVADAFGVGDMTPEELATVKRVVGVFEAENRIPCTACNYCMPCPHGINIPGCFSSYNASFAHGWFTGVQQYFTASELRSGAPRLASMCVRCGACMSHCPQHIAIPDRLEDVRRRFQPGPVNWLLGRMARKQR